MKKTLKTFMILTAVLVASLFLSGQPAKAQAPNKMSYQAVIRNSSDNLVTNTLVGMQISILRGVTPVYTETQTTNTDANGLVSIDIGGGTSIIGTFATINWANGPYFIKTEIDLEGGINYTITGTSQLLSVPYALHSKTAEILISGFTEVDPLFGASPASGITSTNVADWSAAYSWGNPAGLYLPIGYVPAWTDITGKPTFTPVATSGSYTDLANKPTFDGSETQVIAGNKMTVTGSGTASDPYVINLRAHSIGESYGGGIVFYVYDQGQHGLIAYTADTELRWYGGTYTNTCAKGDGVGAGKANTAIIIANQGSVDGVTFAARACNEHSVTVGGVKYGDWYLPSKFELNLLYLQKSVVGGFAYDNYYWSSTEYDSGKAWCQAFLSGSQVNGSKSNSFYVRAIRAF